MFGHRSGELQHRTVWGISELIFCTVLVYIGSGGVPIGHPASGTLPPLGGGVVSGVFVAGAVSAAIVSWRRHVGARTGWLVATGALVAFQSLVVTLVALDNPTPRGGIAMVLLLAVALIGLCAVLGPLLSLHRSAGVVDDGFVIGLGMGLLAAAHLLVQIPFSGTLTWSEELVVAVVLSTHLAAAALVLRQGVLSRPMAWLLVATVVVVGVGQLVHVAGREGEWWVVAVSVASAAAGAAWLTVACVTILRAIEEERRRLDSVELALVSTTRQQSECMHELRSTVAGLVSGSALLDSSEISADMRQHLWDSVRRELDRMQRLVSKQEADATDLDLDQTLELILDLQRLKGRRVELHSSGDAVRARYDSLAEVLNILIDNAATHGGSDSSRVEVVRRDDATVDITVTDFGRGIPEEQRSSIFDWGASGTDSPGEGIGLHVAQRLMTEDGGSLRLVEEQGSGSSFVISLPAARRSTENDLAMEGTGAWLRSG